MTFSGSNDTGYLAPDFVFVGVPMPDGQFMLMASDELTRAELASETEALEALADNGMRFAVPGPNRFNLEATMLSVTFVIGSSYAECLSKLMQTWRPKQDRRPALFNPNQLSQGES